jgi:coiled-coil domain-containing protein 12
MTDRKARLTALAAKAGRSKTADDDGAEKQVTISFRNYAPNDESLLVKQQKEEEIEEPEPKRAKKEEKSALEQAVELAQKEAATVVAEGNVTRMGPKKMNADLKRDIREKLDKLERKTQRAIVSLLKERLEREAGQDVPDLD